MDQPGAVGRIDPIRENYTSQVLRHAQVGVDDQNEPQVIFCGLTWAISVPAAEWGEFKKTIDRMLSALEATRRNEPA